jgi:RNA polymerase sigma factor (sigma-70 family)
MTPLTDQQNDLINEHFELAKKLTFHWAKKGKVLSYDDVYDVCISSLVKAAKKYKPNDECKFTTFYYLITQRNIYRALRDKGYKKREGDLNKISIESKVKNSSGELTVIDSFFTEDEYNFIDQSIIESVWCYLNEREEYCIYNQFYKRRKQSDIAEDLGISQVQVSRIVKKGLDKMKYRIKRQEVLV